MRKEKWLLREIDMWQNQSLIGDDTARELRERYTPKKNTNLTVILFSVIGSLLIGTGIILIGAKNWYSFPLFLRAVVAFIPLVASQGMAFYTLKRRYNSLAWRESVSVLNVAAFFATTAFVGQVFHMPGDNGTYILTCGLFAYPVMCILNTVSPLVVYYWAVLNWLFLNQSVHNAVIMLLLLSLGGLYVFFNRKKGGARLQYMLWLTVAAWFTAVLFIGYSFDEYLVFMLFCYFVMLLAIERLDEERLFPFKAVGVLGSLTMLSIFAFGDYWIDNIYDSSEKMGGFILSAAMIFVAVLVTILKFKHDYLKSAFIGVMIFLCILSGIWTGIDVDYGAIHYIFFFLFNAAILLTGAGFIVYGTKNTSLITTNIGMASVCVWIGIRFVDSEWDILWRGVVFLLLGIVFLLVNLGIVKARKKLKKEEGE